MSATGSGHMSSYASRSGLPTFGNFGSTLLERSNPGLRKSTPDSEALASSDEEVEQSRLRSAQRKTISNRRSSLLGDQNHGDSRQFLPHGGHPYSPSTGSQPNTPSVSQDTWTSISPSMGAWNTASAYPFGPNIWGANSRDPPARLQEVRQDNNSGAENRYPFPIPPQSNPTVQRSMSFSVGQSDYEPTSTLASTSTSTMEYPPRSVPGLTRRSSRPANMGHDFGGLARVNESDGDLEGPYSAASLATVAPPSMSNMPGRNITRTLSSTSTPTNHSLFRSSRSNLNHPGLDISEVAIEDFDETLDMQRAFQQPRQAPASRRMTENILVAPVRQPNNPSAYNPGFAGNTRNATTWSTIPPNSSYSNGPSRRHSFADVPTRRGSPGSSTDDPNTYSLAGLHNNFEKELSPGIRSDYYFAKNDAAKFRAEQRVQQQLDHELYLQSRGMPVTQIMPVTKPTDGSNIENPDLEIYYVVNFKCCRSEIYRIKDGVDIQVNEGDLVMVEGDRGEDLGCVMHGPMTKHMAMKYRLKYTEQHFGWLMMFTAQAHTGSENPFNPNAAVATAPSPNATYNSKSEPKEEQSRKIKRHATAAELDKLQMKEGLEAKAKRDCQVKVNEHGFNMEILDAEYQLDMRKLTFFFFSTEYINFNVLVTDLFKKFKTRIWMYAINPASFQSPLSQMTITPLPQNPPTGNVMPTRNAAHVFTSGNRYGNYLTAYQGQPVTGFNSAFAPPFTNPNTNYAPYVPPMNYQPAPPYPQTSGYQYGYAQAGAYNQSQPSYNQPAAGYAQQQSPAIDPFMSFNNGNGGAYSSQAAQANAWTPNTMSSNTGGHPSGPNGQSDMSANELSGRFGNLNLRR